MSEPELSDCGSALPGATGPNRARKGAPITQNPLHESALRKGRWSWPNHCYFITTNAANKEPLFADSAVAKIIIDSLVWLQDAGRIRLMGFVVMPDHVHVAFVLCEESGRSRPEERSHIGNGVVGAPFRARSGLPSVLNSFKGYTGKKINELLSRHGEVWQSTYHDHLVRDEEDFRTRLSYMHGNPVRKALVKYESDYEFSSANPAHNHLVDWKWLQDVQPVAPGRALPQ